MPEGQATSRVRVKGTQIPAPFSLTHPYPQPKPGSSGAGWGKGTLSGSVERSRRHQNTHARTILVRGLGHLLGIMTRLIFEDRLADIAAREPPSFGEIAHAPANIRFRVVKLLVLLDKAHVAGGLRLDLHKADLAGVAGHALIPVVFDGNHRAHERGGNSGVIRIAPHDRAELHARPHVGRNAIGARLAIDLLIFGGIDCVRLSHSQRKKCKYPEYDFFDF